MVQDTSPSSEMYLYKSPDGKVGGWGIEMEIVDEQRHEVDFANLRETTILWVTSIPGETRWFAECVEGPDSGMCLHFGVSFFCPYLSTQMALNKFTCQSGRTSFISKMLILVFK